MTALAQGRRRRYLTDHPGFLAWLFMSPAVLYILALVGFPFVLAIIYSFTDISTGNPELDFVGWETFRRVLADPVFREALWNTFRFAVIANVLVVVFATALAEVLTRDFKGKWLVRFLVLLPWVAPVSLATVTWLWTLDSIFSPIDWVLRRVGLITENMYWLGLPDLARTSVVAVQAWRVIPLAAVIVMAGLTAIPTEINDAVAVDGAGTWRRMFQVTIPLLAPIIAVAVLFGVILTISDMSVVYVLTRGGPTNSTQVLSTWAFIKGIEGGALGQGAAVALFLLPVLVGITAVVLRLARRREVM
ncbi:MAG TPA: sugar ABC transporter permease [Acidimicrobiia bacterium]|jgi:multiple sugar transport system permease protein|nr:sugar ABC transporter permease [Acidimicrobiia bacterium]